MERDPNEVDPTEDDGPQPAPSEEEERESRQPEPEMDPMGESGHHSSGGEETTLG